MSCFRKSKKLKKINFLNYENKSINQRKNENIQRTMLQLKFIEFHITTPNNSTQ